MANLPGAMSHSLSILGKFQTFPKTLAFCTPAYIERFQYRGYNPDGPRTQAWSLRTDSFGEIFPHDPESATCTCTMMLLCLCSLHTLQQDQRVYGFILVTPSGNGSFRRVMCRRGLRVKVCQHHERDECL
jgi:hypothetical protein